MKVRYRHYRPGVAHGNILWAGKWPMYGGVFPPAHPVGNRPKGLHSSNERAEMGESTAMLEFRGRGYWASCFPEGDGITLTPERDQDAETVARDIRECFGWDVVIERS